MSAAATLSPGTGGSGSVTPVGGSNGGSGPRPSSLPLPKTLSRSSPAERLALRHKNYSSLILTAHARQKLNSVSSCASSSAESTPTLFSDRQAKSLTPERDFMLHHHNRVNRKMSVGSKCPPVKAELKVKVTNGSNRKASSANASHSTTLTVKTKGRDKKKCHVKQKCISILVVFPYVSHCVI